MKKMNSILLALSVVSAAHADWSFQEKSYEMDQSKTACTISTSTKHNDLEFIFPKDQQGYPLVKMTNKYDLNFVSARVYLSDSRVRFIGKDDSGLITFYMIPNSARELETFIGIVKRNRNLKIEKLYQKGSGLKATTGDFSLAGSSKALNSMKACLGGEFLSESQKSLLSSVSQRVSTSSRLSSNYRENMNLGLKVYEGLKNWDSSSAATREAFAKLEDKKQDPEYLQVKSEKDTAEKAKEAAEAKLATIASDENFYENADSIIEGIEAKRDQAKKDLDSLSQSVQNNQEKISEHQEEIDRLNKIVSSESELADEENANVSEIEEGIRKAKESIGALDTAIRESAARQRLLRDASIDLDKNLQDAKWRSDNSRTIKRDTENALYDQFGGKPFEIDLQIEGFNEEYNVLNNRATKASQHKDYLDDIVDLAAKVSAANPGIKRVENELNCFKNSQGAAIAGCLKASMDALNARVNQLLAQRREQEKKRCRFPIGKKRCKRKRDQRIAEINRILAGVEKEKGELQARIDVIRSTGTDPQKEKTIADLTAKLNSLVQKRTEAITATQQKIDRIGSREFRRFPALEDVKKCKVTAQDPCQKIAARSASRLQQTFQKLSDDAETARTNKVAAEKRLADLNQALRTQVDGLESRLFEEYRAARIAFETNATSLDDEISVQDSARNQREISQQTLGSLNVRLGGAKERARIANSAVSRAVRNVDTFKDQVGFDSLVSTTAQQRAQLTEQTRKHGQLVSDASSAQSRRDRIASEVDTYPAQKDELNQTISEQDQALQEILPAFQAMESEIEELRRAAQEARRLEDESKQEVRRGIQLIKNKY